MTSDFDIGPAYTCTDAGYEMTGVGAGVVNMKTAEVHVTTYKPQIWVQLLRKFY